jgi:hypothetical protein
MNPEQRLWQVKVALVLILRQSLGARRGLREKDEMENGRAVASGLW